MVPQASIPKLGARILDLQTLQKMSKSADSPQGTVKVTDTADQIRKKIKVAVTDSGREIVASSEKPAVTNLLTIYSVASGKTVTELEAELEGKGYADLKSGLSDALIAFLAPIQRRYAELTADKAELERLLDRGAEKAQAVAARTLEMVYERVGFLPRSRG
jgi:tryptophanyl-tRNA synthetase